MMIDILTIQDPLIFDAGEVAHHNGKCNYKHALPVYQRLFDDYNKKFNTNYNNFFFGFSKLLMGMDDMPIIPHNINRALEMIGKRKLSEDNKVAYWLKIPEELCLESDFYNFSDAIFELEEPGSVNIDWERDIYSDRESEKQVIFPYIKKEWVHAEINPSGDSYICKHKIPTMKDLIQFREFTFPSIIERNIPSQFPAMYFQHEMPFIIPTETIKGVITIVDHKKEEETK